MRPSVFLGEVAGARTYTGKINPGGTIHRERRIGQLYFESGAEYVYAECFATDCAYSAVAKF